MSIKEVLVNVEVLNQALGKIKSARDCHPNAVDTLVFEAEEILETALAELKAQPAPVQEPVAWLIEYEACAGGMNRGSSLRKFDYVWNKCSFVSEDKDAEIDATKWRNRKETPLYTTPQPAVQQEPVAKDSRDCPYCYHSGSVHCGDVKSKILSNGGDLGYCSNAQVYGRRTPQPAPVQQKMTQQQAAQLIREMAEQPAPVQEPRFFYDEEAGKLWTPEEAKDGPVGMTRLYTSPQPAQQQLAATITITQRGSTRTIDNHFEDCVRDWPDGEYKLYTSPQPAQQQGPVAWIEHYQGSIACNPYREAAKQLPNGIRFDLYTSPQPPAQPLTDEQREEIAKGWRGRNWTVGDIIDAIEAAHNTKEQP